jgi:Uma2 family endonuclease
MSGGTKEHNRIASRIHRRLGNQLEEYHKDCEAFTESQAVKNYVWTVDTPPYFYPDTTVACGETQFDKINNIDILVNPTLLVEVMSRTSEKYDKGEKLELYQQIPSLKEYLIVAQDKPEVILHTKQKDGSWKEQVVTGLTSTITLSSIGCTLLLSDIYENVRFAG